VLTELQEQGGFSDPRIATEEDHGTWHEASAENTVKLINARGPSVRFVSGDVR